MQFVGPLVIAAFATWSGCGGTAQAEPLRIGYNIWVGFGPLFVAQEKSLFAKEGVEVELIMSIPEALYAGLLAGQIDVSGATVDSILPHFDPEQPCACVMVTDESLGADGIVATRDIWTIADLKGKTIAVPHGTVAHFYLNVLLLKEAGLTQDDLEVIDLPAEDAGSAFLMREVDAAVTWEPWLTQGSQSEHGHLLADTSQTPGLIVDCLLAKPEVLDDRQAEFQALARAWDAAVHYIEAHPDEANEVMAHGVGGWLEDPAVFAETLRASDSTTSSGIRNSSALRNVPGSLRRAQGARYAHGSHRPWHLGRVTLSGGQL
jgi:NitT/TauT family transport system substrate-binding protein